MNYSIKQGGSQFHGSVYEFVRNTVLDTWGFFGKLPNAVTGVPVKPIEHSNEYGIVLSGPLVPFGSWKQKVFYFGNYNGFRYSSATPTLMTFPIVAQQQGDFSAANVKIYDPLSQATCTANSTNGPCRYQYGYGPGSTPGLAGNPALLLSGQCGPCQRVLLCGKEYAGLPFINRYKQGSHHRTAEQLCRPRRHGPRQLVDDPSP
jgi:hypothetical protein